MLSITVFFNHFQLFTTLMAEFRMVFNWRLVKQFKYWRYAVCPLEVGTPFKD